MAEKLTEAKTPDSVPIQLHRVLRAQLEGYGRLLSAIRNKREAIRSADIDGITNLCHEENTIAQRLGDLEKYRLQLVGQITETVDPDAEAPLSLNEIVALASGEERAQLSVLAADLRQAVDAVRQESAIVRRAAEALSTHVTGLMQKVQSALSRLPMYGQRGRIEVDQHFSCAVDVTS